MPGGSAPGTTETAIERGARALASIENLVGSMRERRKRDADTLKRTVAQRGAAAEAAATHDAAFHAAGERYAFLQQLRAYVRDLCACLQHKAADVAALEDAREEALRERGAAARAQRDEVRAQPPRPIGAIGLAKYNC